MKISRNWLQTFFEEVLPDAEKLADTLMLHAFEVESIEKRDNDYVLDVKVTPNRGHDCLSHRGIAKEIAAILDIPLVRDPLAIQEIGAFSMKLPVRVIIEDAELCPRYIAWSISDVRVGPSPTWLAERLESIGQRSVNNVVDAANFAMFNIGQPLHIFDADRLESDGKGHAIAVRRARVGEKITLLDGREYTCTDSTPLIVDAVADRPIGIAGVKGGKFAEVGSSTRNLIIESANFSGASVRRAARALKLQTDASDRFQQGISPELAAHGVREVAKLIREIAGGQLAGFADVYSIPQETPEITVSHKQIKDCLGVSFDETVVAGVLDQLGMRVQKLDRKDKEFLVTPPPERLDIECAEDVVEEIGRIVGYNKIPSVELPPLQQAPDINENFLSAEIVREELISKGFSEVYTSVFADEGERVVANKVDGVRPYLRRSLTPGLMAAFEKNVSNRFDSVALFEIGTVWKDGTEVVMVGSVDSGGVRERKLPTVKQAARYPNFPISSCDRYVPFSKFPFVVRDISFFVPSTAKPDDACALIRASGGSLLVRCDLLDEFEKDGKRSFTFHLVFQSYEKTLTNEEVNKVMEKVEHALTDKGYVVR